LAFIVFGPLLNLVLWRSPSAGTSQSHPLRLRLRVLGRVFSPRGGALAALGTSVWIAVLTVVLSLAVAIRRAMRSPDSSSPGGD